MKKIAKNNILITAIITFIVFLILEYGFNIKNFGLKGAIAGVVGFLLSPKRKTVSTQTGKKTYITWFLLKEPLVLYEK